MSNLEVSVSRVGKYNDCPRWYYYRYKSDVPKEPHSTDDMDVGTLVHNALESVLSVKNSGDAQTVDEAFKTAKAVIQGNDSYSMSARQEALKIFRAYGRHVFDNMGIDRVATIGNLPGLELPFSIELMAGVNVRGYIDAIVETDRERTLVSILDWKVRNYPVEPIRVELDFQLYVYVWAMRQIGVHIDRAAQVQLIRRGIPSKIENVDLKRQVRLTPVDLSRTDAMVNNFRDNVRKMLTDETLAPVGKSYTCRFCEYKNACLNDRLALDNETE